MLEFMHKNTDLMFKSASVAFAQTKPYFVSLGILISICRVHLHHYRRQPFARCRNSVAKLLSTLYIHFSSDCQVFSFLILSRVLTSASLCPMGAVSSYIWAQSDSSEVQNKHGLCGSSKSPHRKRQDSSLFDREMYVYMNVKALIGRHFTSEIRTSCYHFLQCLLVACWRTLPSQVCFGKCFVSRSERRLGIPICSYHSV